MYVPLVVGASPACSQTQTTMEPIERVQGYRETVERIESTRAILSLVDAFEGMAAKHSFEPERLAPATKDPSLTLEQMGAKVEALEQLQSSLLPCIRDQLAALVGSLDLIDPKKTDTPRTEPTRELLSGLDKTLESTVAAVVCLTLHSPLPDEKHDHGLERLKVFRCAHLREKIQLVVSAIICERLFRDDIPSFIRWCAMANILDEYHPISTEGSDLRKGIQITMAYPPRILDQTIAWCRKSDWALVHEAWLKAAESTDEVLETFVHIVHPMIQSPSQADDPPPSADDGQRDPSRRLIAEPVKSAIPLTKLARILLKKTSAELAKKRLSSASGATVELTSETMARLYEAPQAVFRLQHLASLLSVLDRPAGAVEHRANIRMALQTVPEAMAAALAALDACLLPLLGPTAQRSSDTYPSSFLPLFKQSWETASDHSGSLILSFEAAQLAIQ